MLTYSLQGVSSALPKHRKSDQLIHACYLSVHNSTRTQVAIKIIELDSPESVDEDILEIQREVALLSSLRDAERNNCTSYHGSWLHSTQLWLAMDYAAGGSIRTIVSASTLRFFVWKLF